MDKDGNKKGLNPCCAGLWSLTESPMELREQHTEGLNPCCAGLWSLTPAEFQRANNPARS